MEKVWLSGNPLYMMIGLVLLTIAIVLLFPKVSKSTSLPASLLFSLVLGG
jgi:SulP family sulfate permease